MSIEGNMDKNSLGYPAFILNDAIEKMNLENIIINALEVIKRERETTRTTYVHLGRDYCDGFLDGLNAVGESLNEYIKMKTADNNNG
jgi:hypothetical protein